MLICCLPLLYAGAGAKNPKVLSVDKKAKQIPDSVTRNVTNLAQYIETNFTGDEDRVRAIYVWITNNIDYDAARLSSLSRIRQTIEQTLELRRGVCADYATLFNEMCRINGIKTHYISGSTRKKEKVSAISHAWCCAFVAGKWQLYDPTWGAGTVNEEKKSFQRRFNNAYFQILPEQMIQSHMPFDYLWQLLENPVSAHNFLVGNIDPSKATHYFNYPDSIALWEEQSRLEQLRGERYRIERNGIDTPTIVARLSYLRKAIDAEERKQHRRTSELP